MTRRTLALALVGVVLGLGGLLMAQPAGNNPQDQGNRGTRQRPTAQEMQQRMEQMRDRVMDQARTQLGFSEEEWKEVKPLYLKVAEINRDLTRTNRGMMMMQGGRTRGPGQPGADNAPPAQPQAPQASTRPEDNTPLALARVKLDEVVRNEAAPAAELQAALDGYRAARLQTQKDLDNARQALREVLSLRQEAMLVSNGTLD